MIGYVLNTKRNVEMRVTICAISRGGRVRIEGDFSNHGPASS